MVLNVHRNHKAYWGRVCGGERELTAFIQSNVRARANGNSRVDRPEVVAGNVHSKLSVCGAETIN